MNRHRDLQHSRVNNRVKHSVLATTSSLRFAYWGSNYSSADAYRGGLVLLFNPFHVIGSLQKSLFSILILFLHMPVSLLVPSSELVVASVATFLLTRAVALMGYLRAVYRAQEAYHKL